MRNAIVLFALLPLLGGCASDTGTVTYGFEGGEIGRPWDGGDSVETASAYVEYSFHKGARSRHREVIVAANRQVAAINRQVDAFLTAQREQAARDAAALEAAERQHLEELEVAATVEAEEAELHKREADLWDLLFKVAGGLGAAVLAGLGVKEVRRRRAVSSTATEDEAPS